MCSDKTCRRSLQCRNLQYQIAARITNATEPASWATGPYFPYPNLNVTGHVLVRPCVHVVSCLALSISQFCHLLGSRPAPSQAAHQQLPW